MSKKVDVIIPAYKAQNTISKTIASILEQSIVDDLKVVIVNDADNIGYADIVQSFLPFVDIEEIKLSVNSGPGVARQYGIDNTHSPYFTCIDADDTFYGAFSLEILLKPLEENPEYHTCVGNFIEQNAPNMSFVQHSNDLIWMFGKMYRRSFIEHYKIRFNDSRANEDNGFNTIVRLCSSDTEKIMFLTDPVYFWHYKEDSITRINNAEYSYNQSFIGYTNNMIYAIAHARRVNPFNSYIDVWAIQVMAHLYIYYMQTCVRDPRFKEQNFKSCVEYYNRIFKPLRKSVPKEHLDGLFSQVLIDQAPSMVGIVPEMTMNQFLDLLESANKPSENTV